MPKSVSTDAEKLVKEINASLAQNPHTMWWSRYLSAGRQKDDNEDYINVYKRAEYRMYRKKLSEKRAKEPQHKTYSPLFKKRAFRKKNTPR